NAGDGNNEVGAENFGAAAATVVTGKNNDSIRLISFDLDTALTVNAGNGANNVLVEDFDAGQGDGPNGLPHGGGAVTIVTGAGNDGNDPGQDFPIEVDNVTVAGNVTVLGGSGNDRLEVRNEFDEHTGTGIRGNLIVSGGAGNDDITIGGAPGEDRGLDVGKN